MYFRRCFIRAGTTAATPTAAAKVPDSSSTLLQAPRCYSHSSCHSATLTPVNTAGTTGAPLLLPPQLPKCHTHPRHHCRHHRCYSHHSCHSATLTPDNTAGTTALTPTAAAKVPHSSQASLQAPPLLLPPQLPQCHTHPG